MDFSAFSQLATGMQIQAANQNGYAPGSLQNYSVGTDGVITGIYTNGLTRSLGQIAMAIFSNPGGLERQGSNLYRNTDNSGVPVIGAPRSGGRGQLNAGFLEQSNVDIGTEFTDLIVTQRGFQANTRVVTTVDEMLQDLINMKR
jgi:flagellar hook protein FlgE